MQDIKDISKPKTIVGIVWLKWIILETIHGVLDEILPSTKPNQGGEVPPPSYNLIDFAVAMRWLHRNSLSNWQDCFVVEIYCQYAI